MNAVYIRLIVYTLSTVLGMIPAAWAGWIAYDASAQVLSVSIPGLVAAAVAGLAVTGGIFARWGIK